MKILIHKYDQNQINRKEYDELLSILKQTDSEGQLDDILTDYWNEGKVNKCTIKEEQKKSSSKSLYKLPGIMAGVAATFLLVLGFYFYFGANSDVLLGKREIVYQTGYGEKLDVQLDDGSTVTLNANSLLRWSEDWEKSKARNVIIEGEAFFEVKKRDGIPFTVNANDVTVEVLGTSFNVDSREKNTRVYLEEGKINLKLNKLISESPAEESSGTKQINEMVLEPGEQIKYSAKDKKIEKEDGLSMIAAASWKLDVLNFKNMKFHEVLDLLRDIYGQSFECSEGDLLTTPMYLGVPYSNWEAVRKALELSLNIEFERLSERRYKVTTK